MNIKKYKLLDNNDELIIDDKLRYHLFRNCEELTKDKDAIFATSYINNWWKYRDTLGFEHLFNENNEEVNKDIKTMFIECYSNNYWKYMLKNGSWVIYDNNNNNITPNVDYIYECSVYNDGSLIYRESQNSQNIIHNPTN